MTDDRGALHDAFHFKDGRFVLAVPKWMVVNGVNKWIALTFVTGWFVTWMARGELFSSNYYWTGSTQSRKYVSPPDLSRPVAPKAPPK
jgi:hypothetical protein